MCVCFIASLECVSVTVLSTFAVFIHLRLYTPWIRVECSSVVPGNTIFVLLGADAAIRAQCGFYQLSPCSLMSHPLVSTCRFITFVLQGIINLKHCAL